MAVPLAFGYLFWEFCYGFFCWRVLAAAPMRRDERIAAWLGVQLLIVPALAQRLSAFELLVLVLTGALCAWKWAPVPADCTRFAVWPILPALLPLLAMFLRPVREPDSLFNLHFVLDWIYEGKSVYDFAFHYVPFWEASYVPSIVLGGDAYLWVWSLKAIALLGALLWLIADEFQIAGSLRILGFANAMLFLHLWHGASGLSTIKNDMIAAAGQAALALGVLRLSRGQFSWMERAVLTAGAVFVSTKFSGPVLLVFVVPLVVWLLRGRMGREWPWMAGAAVVWIACVGHVYIRNAWMYGNPVYPFQVNLGPLHLAGLGDLTSTSILYNLNNPEVWRLFFLPEGDLSPLGLLFPLTFAALPIALWWGPKPFAVFTCAALLVYLRSIYSACGQPGDLQFVKNDLNSFRYYEGAYLAAELFLLSLLTRWPPAAIGVAAVSAASRAWILVVRVQPEPPPDWGLFAIACIPALVGAGIALLRPRWVAASLLLLIAAGGVMVESRRNTWLPQWRKLYSPFHGSNVGDLFLIVDDSYSEQACAHLPFQSQGYGRRVRSGPIGELKDEQYVAWIRRPGQSEPVLPDFKAMARNENGVVFERVRR